MRFGPRSLKKDTLVSKFLKIVLNRPLIDERKSDVVIVIL